MNKTIRIGTRGSDLALWQANTVKDLLENEGVSSELHIIHSTGDKNRKSKLHEMGLVGVFTKELDDALLLGEIDIAVHSLKDVPTSPPVGIVQCAVLERANPFDLLITSDPINLENHKPLSLATGSLRRRAFWLSKFPKDQIKDLRGNVPSRLQKLESNDIDGIILANAGVKRLGIETKNSKTLEWMTPAPAQGIVGIFCLEKNKNIATSLKKINNREAEICAHVERDLLKTLEGGCTAPIGAYAKINKDSISIKASLLSVDGKKLINKTLDASITSYKTLGASIANEMLADGGKAIMKEINQKEDGLTKVLCLKKLTPPRIKLGRTYGFELLPHEVIQTLPEYDSYKVASALRDNNNYIFSSLNAVSAITKVLKNTSLIHKNIFCVGSRVANFFDGKVKSIRQVNSISQLTEIAKNSGESNFVWFHGNKSDLTLINEFEHHELTVIPSSVYRTENSCERIEELDSFGAYLFFSPSGVESFSEHNYIPENTVIAAIGDTTAKHISEVYKEQKNTQLENIVVPQTFEFETLLATLKAHYKTHGTH